MFKPIVIVIFALAAVVPNGASGETLDMGGESACAVVDGGVQCWGFNYYGDLGDGAQESRGQPSWVASLGEGSGVTDVSVGYYNSCAVAAGDVWCWGHYNTAYFPDSLEPIKILDGDTYGDVQSVAVGSGHACALVDGGVVCWGDGLLGDGVTTESLTPVVVDGLSPGSAAGVTQVAVGGEFACAVVNGGVLCWGLGEDGRLGNGTTDDQPTPEPVTGLQPGLANPSVTSIALARSGACARLSNATVHCWGENTYGQLGNGSAALRSLVPVAVLVDGSQTPLNFVAQLSAGANHVCARIVSGTLACWGKNTHGQLGINSTDYQDKAIPVPNPLGAKIVNVAASNETTCAAFDDAQIRCWGSNQWGTLGIGKDALARVPELVSVVPNGGWPLSAGSVHTCANRQGGAWCWGGNAWGQVGSPLSPPRDKILGGWVGNFAENSGVTQISAGYRHSCLRTTSSSLWCWGDNFSGQLGNGSNQSTHVPVQVTGSFAQVASGGFHTCAVASNGQARCWGSGYSGKLGNASLSDSSQPVPVMMLDGLTPLSGISRIAAARSHSCAISGSNVYCWGDNYEGALGYETAGANKYSSVARAVVGLPPNVAARITIGDEHSCASMQDGSVWCWGAGWTGQTGTGYSGHVPHQVDIGAVSDLAAGDRHTCALVSGAVYCWGDNSYGQLGDGTLVERDEPTKVLTPSESFALSITAGDEHTCAGFFDGTQYCWGNGLYGRRGNLQLGYTPYITSTPIVFASTFEGFADGFE